ncbi:oxidoreductase-like domain-containing protein [Frateuria defendens]|uniref:oxidoreductase-like domain-containing protein n=1 Tax=Frateuria defendens TaxID=2219559 RepID=UPI0009E61D64|nr:oxidoreductase-like domain-containing protein [Frateuria defendens]
MTTSLPSNRPADPRPQPPPAPAPGDCCGEGCSHCVLDRYELELARYRDALAAWLARHPEAHGGV